MPYIAADGLNGIILSITFFIFCSPYNGFLIITRFILFGAKSYKSTETIINIMPNIAAGGLNSIILSINFPFFCRTYNDILIFFGLTILNTLLKDPPNVTYTIIWGHWCSRNVMYTIVLTSRSSRNITDTMLWSFQNICVLSKMLSRCCKYKNLELYCSLNSEC